MNKSRHSGAPKFERLPLSKLRQGRQGKHHDLMNRIAEEMESLPDGEAMGIPFADLDIPLANLRSAVTRAMGVRDVKVGTFFDGKSLYVWKKTARTARYERKSRIDT